MAIESKLGETRNSVVEEFDDLVIGAGMGGLTVASLLARAGRRVLVLEAHDVPGGYAHTFTVRDYRFCAQVHYIFNCGEGESVHRFLSKLGLAEEVPFVRLDVEGFDHVVVGGERVRICNGLPKLRDRLLRRFPEAAKPLRRYFETVTTLANQIDQLDTIPEKLTPSFIVSAAYRLRHVLRYRNWTLGDFYDAIAMPPKLRAFLAGQCGDYLLPPRDISFLLHVALVHGYDRGAYYPRKHFFQFVEAVAKTIDTTPGCRVLLEHEVDRIEVAGDRVVSVATKNGKRFTAKRYISNADPKLTARLAGTTITRDPRLRDYAYSCGTFTMYLGVRGLDLRDYGFGSHNVWHYPHDDLDRIYDDQLVRHDLSQPWLFMSTPTLHSDEPGICPAGDQILEVATCCDHARFDRLRRTDRRAYNLEKKKIRETILDVIEAHYVPRLREHLVLRLTGTPATNARYCWAPEGNAYGAALVPQNLNVHRRPQKSSLENLWLVNATAGLPSVAGTVGAGLRLYTELTGDKV
jgi:all-trans-retinol 13,14-reductase